MDLLQKNLAVAEVGKKLKEGSGISCGEQLLRGFLKILTSPGTVLK